MMPLNKRGQMTLFIIAGIVILFVAFYIGYLQNESLRLRVEKELFKTEVVPEQAKSVVSYVNTCIGEILDDGLDLIAYQGGYVEIPEEIKINPRKYLQADPVSKVPYWIYGNNKDVPTISEMENQLEDYIDRRFGNECDFTDFSDYIFTGKDIESDVLIFENSVSAKIDSNMDVNIKENDYSLEDYVSIERESNLRFLYDVAVDVVNREIENSPIEFVTMNLISTFASDKSIPPVAGFDFSCNPKKWTVDKTAKDVQGYLSDRLRYIQIENTEVDVLEAYYKNLLITNVFSDSKDVYVDFEYIPGWPFLIEIYPNEGKLLKPTTIKFGLPFLPLLCLNTYDFRYSLVFPLMVVLEKDGELFRFPIEVFIVDNYGARQISGGVEDFDFEEGKEITFCDEEQRLSEPVKIVTFDALNQNALEDVEVNYQCGVFDCLIGNTKLKNSESALDEKFPLCYNGKIRLNREYYLEQVQEITTLGQGRQIIVVEMKPFVEREIEVKIVEVDGSVRNMRSEEEASVQFNLVDKEFGGFKNQRAVVISGIEKENLEFAPEEEYEVTANLVLNQKLFLRGAIVKGQEIDGQEIESILLGGAKFNQYITEEDLGKKKVIVYVVSEGIPETVLGYFDASDLDVLTAKYGNLMRLEYE